MIVSKVLQIGITGGIGSGKSLICKIFKCLGIPVYDADSRAKYLMTTDGILIEDIKKEFGNLSYEKDGALNRKHLSDATFRDPARLAKLNSLVHPRVAVDFSNWVAAQHHPYIIKEAALLYEAGSYKTLDKIIVVTAPENIRIQRVLARDPHRTERMIRDIMKNQMPEPEMSKKADFRVVNDGAQMVIPQVLELHQRFVASKN